MTTREAHDEGAVCLCVADHRPPILEYHRHHIRPAALGGSDDPSNLLFLCLAPESRVLMADGSRRPIVTLHVGDLVMAYDGSPAPISAVSRSWFDGHLTVLGGLALTPEHPVLTPTGWTRAGDLGSQAAVLSEPFREGVDSHVLSLILAEPQIDRPVVEGIQVDVVDDLFAHQRASEDFFHDDSVFHNGTAGVTVPDSDDPVTTFVEEPLSLPLEWARDAVQRCEATLIGAETGPGHRRPSSGSSVASSELATTLRAGRHRPGTSTTLGGAFVGTRGVRAGTDRTGNFVGGSAHGAGAHDHAQTSVGHARWNALDHVGSARYSGWVYDITIPRYGSYFAEDVLVHNCPSTHDNTHELMRMMFAAGRVLSHYELVEAQDRPVSRYAARIARAGYEATTGAMT